MATYRAAHATQWHSTLQWLHQLTPEPPPYRTNLWRKLDHTTRTAYFTTLGHIYDWILARAQPLQDPTRKTQTLSGKC